MARTEYIFPTSFLFTHYEGMAVTLDIFQATFRIHGLTMKEQNIFVVLTFDSIDRATENLHIRMAPIICVR